MKIKNKGSFSLELIAIVVCVILVAVLALRTFGGQISSTIHDSTNTVESVTSNVLNQYGSGGSGSGGAGGGSGTPTQTANYYKNNTNGFIVTKATYDAWPEDFQNMYSEHFGDVYKYTLASDPGMQQLTETQVNPWYKVTMSTTQGGSSVDNVLWARSASEYTIDQEVTQFGPKMYVTSITETVLTEDKVQ